MLIKLNFIMEIVLSQIKNLINNIDFISDYDE